MCVYVKSSLNACHLAQFSSCTEDIEIITLELNELESHKLIIVNIYRPPSGDCKKALDRLHDVCSQLLDGERHLDFVL